MKRLIRLLCIIACAACFQQCGTPDYLSPKELDEFIADERNQFTRRIQVAGHGMNVSYRPTDFWIHREVKGLKIDSSTYRELQDRYSNYYYFVLSLSVDNREELDPVNGGLPHFSELVQTMSFRMDRYAALVTSAHDTIPVADFMLNRTFGLSDATSILFVFNKEKCIGKESVCFILNEFGLGVGIQRFKFKIADLENTPRLKFEMMSSSGRRMRGSG